MECIRCGRDLAGLDCTQYFEADCGAAFCVRCDDITIIDKNNGACEVEFLRNVTPKSPQGLSPLSAFSARKIQNSTPCDWFAKVWSSTLEISQLYASGSTVTLRRILRSESDFLAIICNFITHQHINNHNVVCALIAEYAIGVTKDGRKQAISGRFEDVRPVRIHTEIGNSDRGRESNIDDRQTDGRNGRSLRDARESRPGDILRSMGRYPAAFLTVAEVN